MPEQETWTFRIKPYDEATHDRERHGVIAARYVAVFRLQAALGPGTFVSAVEDEDGTTAVTYSVPVIARAAAE